MRPSLLPLLAPLALLAAPAAAQFTVDCAAASDAVAAAICETPGLQALDRRLAARLEAALAVTRTLGAGAAEAGAALGAGQRRWIGSRDACRQTDDIAACLTEAYQRRIADLVGRYLLEQPTSITTWRCADGAGIVAYHFAIDPPAIRLEYGDRIDTGVLAETASGGRYEASFGTWFSPDGDAATASMQLGGQGPEVACTLTDRRDGA